VRTAVVINPTKVADLAGQRERIGAALAAAGCPAPLWFETTQEDPGRGQTRAALAAGVTVVFACGGDGTVRACADQLAGTEVALAVMPAGTGNLLAANLDLPSDVESSVAAAVSGRRRRIDLGCLDGQHFALMTGIGFDAAMMAATPESWKRVLGWPAYVLGGLRRWRDRPMRVSISLDGGPALRRTARMVLVANLGRLQGGLDLFGDAQPDDGRLDIAVIGRPGPTAIAGAVMSALRGQTPRTRHLETFQASQVDIRSTTPHPRELDGDLIEPGDRLLVTVRPASLWVCGP